MKHHVEIDEQQIASVFARYESQPEQEFIGAGDQPHAEATGAGWSVECNLLGDMLFAHVCPGWNVPPDKQAEFKRQLAIVLDRWFPGGIGLSDNWGPLPQLLFTTGSIVLGCGFDFKTLHLRPLKIIDPAEAGEAERVHPSGASTGKAYSTTVDA
jgi:hypothetical protein